MPARRELPYTPEDLSRWAKKPVRFTYNNALKVWVFNDGNGNTLLYWSPRTGTWNIGMTVDAEPDKGRLACPWFVAQLVCQIANGYDHLLVPGNGSPCSDPWDWLQRGNAHEQTHKGTPALPGVRQGNAL